MNTILFVLASIMVGATSYGFDKDKADTCEYCSQVGEISAPPPSPSRDTSSAASILRKVPGTPLEVGGLNGKKLPFVVQVFGNGGKASGFLGPNCTLFTAMHVVEAGLTKDNPNFISTLPGGTLKDKVYLFRAEDPDGKTPIEGKVKIRFHGTFPEIEYVAGDNLSCEKTQKLGFAFIDGESRYQDLQGLPLYMAGHPFQEKSGIMDGNTLIVDPSCQLYSRGIDGRWITDCFSDFGSSGGLLGSTSPEYPELKDSAHGIVVNKFVPEDTQTIAELKMGTATGVIPFTAIFADNPKISKWLNEMRTSPDLSPAMIKSK